MCSKRVLQGAAAERAARDADLEVWLAGPSARAHFDMDALTPPDRSRREQMAGSRRLPEWEVSRALLAFVREGRASGPLSLSHSAGHAAIARSDAASSVGVDVEELRERDFLRLSRFAFSDAEHAQLEALPPIARAERFYILWTLKEAFAKALSLPLLQSVSRCTFEEGDGAWRANVPAPGDWIAQVFRPRSTLVLSVVALLSQPAPENPRVKLLEWPGEKLSPWPELATLRAL
ncbi:MAG: 4'-phosphopantetheinyl transferase superfamily protein [Gammaproteobacteria bacterium]